MIIDSKSWQKEFAEQVNSGPVRTFQLELSHKERVNIVRNFINFAEDKKFNSRFSLLYANCAIYSLKNLFQSVQIGLLPRIVGAIQKPIRFVPSQSPKLIKRASIGVEELDPTPFKYNWNDLKQKGLTR